MRAYLVILLYKDAEKNRVDRATVGRGHVRIAIHLQRYGMQFVRVGLPIHAATLHDAMSMTPAAREQEPTH